MGMSIGVIINSSYRMENNFRRVGKGSPQSAHRPQRKILLPALVGIALPPFVDPQFLSASVLRNLCSLCYKNGCAKGALDCGGSTPPLPSSSVLFQGGVEPPQSKALRAFSCAVASRRLMGIWGEILLGLRRVTEAGTGVLVAGIAMGDGARIDGRYDAAALLGCF
jgi:hypothetical protein